MYGLKNVRHRRTDALAQVGWDQLETMLAVYYLGQGYRVDHVGTGASGSRFDGGIDLKLYKDNAYIVVQSKHWNAKQVTHNAVHELIGVMVTQGATGAILVTSGEFSRYAIESAAKQGHVQLVDGDDLREMLGPLPEVAPTAFPVGGGRSSAARGIAAHIGERLLGAAEDRIRGGGRGQRRRGVVGDAMAAGLGILLLKLVFALIIFWVMTSQIQSVVRGLQSVPRGNQAAASQRNALPVPGTVPAAGVLQSIQSQRSAGDGVIDHGSGVGGQQAGMPAFHAPTAAERRESKRQADEAMRILEASTPEM